MKPVKNFLFAVLLVFVMVISTPAGELDTPGAVPPPPQMTTPIDNTPIDGSDPEQAIVDPSDYLFLDALVALLSAY